MWRARHGGKNLETGERGVGIRKNGSQGPTEKAGLSEALSF